MGMLDSTNLLWQVVIFTPTGRMIISIWILSLKTSKMSIFSRYVDGFASNFRGLASGRLRLEGPLAAPELSGRARLVRTGFKIDYLNTAYTFAHEIEVGKDFIRFDNLTLNDTLGKQGQCYRYSSP
jgi:hypothetical protein